MLAMVNMRGEVEASVPGLAKRAGVTLEQCEQALECFRSPDRYSRTQDHDGRRIRDIEGGWELLNHGKYRALLSAEERREYNRRKQADYRGRNKNTGELEKQAKADPKNGFVYYAKDGDRIKIGFSKNPWARVLELKTSCPQLELIGVEEGNLKNEEIRHKQFASFQIEREWFRFEGELKNLCLSLSMTVNDNVSNAHITEADTDTDTEKNNTPLPPKGGNGSGQRRVLPTGWERWPLRKQKSERVHYNNKLMGRIGKFFNQRETTLWSVADAGILSKINPEEQDVALMEEYYLSPSIGEHDIRRKDLPTLLNNWNGELNRANIWKCQNT
jgi:hypothetical protein